MQKEKTLKFWDDFYEKESQSNATEWIVQPSEEILQSIVKYLLKIPKKNNVVNGNHKHSILEIGAGNSTFSLQLWGYLQNNNSAEVNMLATDVSSICILQNTERDKERILQSSFGSFSYEILNVLEPPSHKMSGIYDIVLDKGCCDTFLFRSEKTKSGSHSPLLKTLFDNIHTWLTSGGVYIIFSPRSRIKAARDFVGFSSVERIKLDSDNNQIGALDGKAENNGVVYMHVCTKNDAYARGDNLAFRNQIKVVMEDERCTKCGISFVDFRKGEDIVGKGVNYWGRRWRGHLTHCK